MISITTDFETRSACDLLKCGGWVYSLHPTTKVMCLRWKIGDDGEVGLWHPAFHAAGLCEAPYPTELIEAIENGTEVEAHNAFFERSIWRNQMVRVHGWPDVPHMQWRCSASKACAMTLPRALGNAAEAMHLPIQKDMDGRRLMLKMCKPRKPRKAEVEKWVDDHREKLSLPEKTTKTAAQKMILEAFPMPLLWHESREDLDGLFDYCGIDVESEHCLSNSILPLTPYELRVWQMDQTINERGIYVDLEMIEGAMKIAADLRVRLNKDLHRITEGEIEKATQRDRVKAWLAERGLKLPNMQGVTIDEVLKDGTLGGEQVILTTCSQSEAEDVYTILRIYRALNRTSLKKYETMKRMRAPDGRIRDTIMYHGAGTGRWAGKGVQPHNFPRGTLKDPDTAAEVILTGDLDWLLVIYDDAMEVLSSALRSAICAPPGREIMVADYAAIEARVVFWLADCQAGLDVFNQGDDIYKDLATVIFLKLIEDIDAEERRLGKQGILGLGYCMGAAKFKDTCAKYGIEIRMSLAIKVVKLYRSRYPEIKEMWDNLEGAAIAAVANKGSVHKTNKTAWKMQGRFLYCRLPSGRKLSYCEPKLIPENVYFFKATDDEENNRTIMVRAKPGTSSKQVMARARREATFQAVELLTTAPPPPQTRDSLTYMSVHPKTKKWERTDTYGGKLTENVTQAVARDLMAEAMLRAEDDSVYDIVTSVHDELVCEVDEGVGSVEEFEALMAMTGTLPDWAKGCPVAAEGWRGKRYRK